MHMSIRGHGRHFPKRTGLYGVVLFLVVFKLSRTHKTLFQFGSKSEDIDFYIPEPNIHYKPEPGKISTGVLSEKPPYFFKDIRFRIDSVHPYDRCRPYNFLKEGFQPDEVKPAQRRIFYGALIADEPWELFEIVASETYQVFEGMVFVESDRTQHYTPRPLQRQGHEEKLQELFGTNNIQIRTYVNENPMIRDLAREQEQRQEIIKGWKELGMTENDIGYLADIDETFTRDFLRALQECPHVEFLDYDSHHCHPVKARINGAARVFESSPECIAKGRAWHHPDVIIGHCIELIGNETKNPIAPRQNQFQRASGFGQNCNEDGYNNITGGMFPLWSAADFRSLCGGTMVRHNKKRGHEEFTAYHFHNFFPDFNQTRFKYKTYGHPYFRAFTTKMEDLHSDLELVSRCVHNMANSEPTRAKTNHAIFWHREEGGLNGTLPYWPVYFHDADYRERKAQALREAFLADEASLDAYVKSRQVAELARRAKLLKNSKILKY